MLREGATGQFTGVPAGPGSYGASQAGAIMRYRLMSGGKGSPFIYARASKALVDSGETDLASGVGVAPVPALPLSVHGELRLTRRATSTSLRPSIYGVLGPPPLRLTPTTNAEAYVQAGYVGGKDASLFADGQARIEQSLVTTEAMDTRLGLGAWGGAQEGAARLDFGPTASVRFKLAEASLRLSLDYRIRVAGDAVPDSGVALTLSGGF